MILLDLLGYLLLALFGMLILYMGASAIAALRR